MSHRMASRCVGIAGTATGWRLCGDGAVQVGERAGIVERLRLGQDAGQHLQGTLGLGHEPFELGMRLASMDRVVAALVEEALGAAFVLGRRQVEEGQEVPAFMVGAVGAEGGVTLLVDQPRRRIGKAGAGILVGRDALGLEEQGPAGAEALQDVVEPRADRDELGLGGAVEVGAAVAQRALERAVLVEDDAGSDQAGPRQVVVEADGLACGIRRGSACQRSLVAGVAGQHGEEGRVLARDPDGDGVAGEPDQRRRRSTA